MTIQVTIAKGFYRGKQISGTFPLIKPYAEGARGGFITVKNSAPEHGHPPVQRITVEKGDFTIVNGSGEPVSDGEMVSSMGLGNLSGKDSATVTSGSDNYEKLYAETETEEEAMVRIAETFSRLDKVVDSCARGIIRGLVVSGPPGIGKSFGVEKQLETANMIRVLNGENPYYEVVSGGVSPIGLYQKLYNNRTPNQVLVFDDCDGILFEEESLNLLKAALNSGHKRRICWNKESRVLQENDIPDFFDFEGSIIFLSNIDFERSISRGSRISSHLSAIMSRCHYMDLEISSTRDKLLRIKQICKDGMLSNYGFTSLQEQEIVEYVFDNAEFLRELSLRMVKKIADFVATDPSDWREMTESTCLVKEARFKRLLEIKRREAAKQEEAQPVTDQ